MFHVTYVMNGFRLNAVGVWVCIINAMLNDNHAFYYQVNTLIALLYEIYLNITNMFIAI